MTQNKRAFTLIELLVVILIIGILAAVAVPQYQKAVTKSRFSTVLHLVHSLYEAEQIYHLSNREYTTDIDELDVDLPEYEKSTDGFSTFLKWGNG